MLPILSELAKDICRFTSSNSFQNMFSSSLILAKGHEEKLRRFSSQVQNRHYFCARR